MKMKLIMTIMVLSCGLGVVNADDYQPIIHKAAQLYYPNDKARREFFIKREEIAAQLFNNFAGDAEIKADVVKAMKALCIHKHPYSMERRFNAMQDQVSSYRFLNKGVWANGLPKEAKAKILAVGKMIWGGDYELRHQWAVAEALAFKRLKLIKFDKSAAAKKWPNSYQSQIIEVMSIRPGTPLPETQQKFTRDAFEL